MPSPEISVEHTGRAQKAGWGNTMTNFTIEGFKSQVVDVVVWHYLRTPKTWGSEVEKIGVWMWQWDEFTVLLNGTQ